MSETNTNVDDFRVNLPRYVGGYRMGDVDFATYINLSRKPSAWHRFWMRVAFGWVWVDL